MRPLIPATMVVLGILLATAASAEVASVPPTASTEQVDIRFVDERGWRQDGPYLAVEGAYPGMPPRSSEVAVSNSGTTPVAYDIRVTLADGIDMPTIAHALVVTVTAASHEVLYQGTLGNLQVVGAAPLAPAETVRLDMRIAWPDGGHADNRLQGQALKFDISARARQTS